MADGDAPTKRRLFVGTFLPEADMTSLGELCAHNEKLSQDWQRKLRWVRPEKLHLTWVFLGSVDESLIPEIKETLDEVLKGARPMDVEYAKPTFWPSARNARTFVITPNSVPEDIAKLAKKIKSAMASYAERIEHDYRPHITIMRMEGGRRNTRIALPDWFPLAEKLPLKHHIDRIDLIQSHMGGSRNYESLAKWDL